jgi:hypothetical protein
MGKYIPNMSPMALLETTRSLLADITNSGTSLRQIALEFEGEVEYDWLKRFATGEIKDPSVNRVQSLHDCLLRKSQAAA